MRRFAKYALGLALLPTALARGQDVPPPPSPAVPLVETPVSVTPQPLPQPKPLPAAPPAATPTPAATLPGTVVPAAPCYDANRPYAVVSQPMPVYPTVGQVAIDCNGNVTGCPTCSLRSRLAGMNPLKWLFGMPRSAGTAACGPAPAACAPAPAPVAACAEPKAARPRRSFSIELKINMGGPACDTCETAAAGPRVRPARGCLTKVHDWLCFKEDYTKVIPVLRPTPYHAPLLAYFAGQDCGECRTGGGCAGGACAAGPVVRGRPVMGLLDRLRPSGFGFGHGNIAGNCQSGMCPTGTCSAAGCGELAPGLKFANPTTAPNVLPGQPTLPSGTGNPTPAVVPAGFPQPVAPASPSAVPGTPATTAWQPLAARPFTKP